MRVLLADDASKVMVGSAAPWRLVDGAGTTIDLPAGSLVVPASLVVDGRQLVSPLTFRPGKAPVEAGALAYRGTLVVDSTGAKLALVNSVPLEAYLDGVVGEEMPASWPAAALEAQAIAARSYALAQIADVVTESPFDLYDDWRSQAYRGHRRREPAVTRAVSQTAGEIVVYDGKVATTYFSSARAGRRPRRPGTGTPSLPRLGSGSLRRSLPGARLGPGASSASAPVRHLASAGHSSVSAAVRAGPRRRGDRRRAEQPGDHDRGAGRERSRAPLDLVPGRRPRPETAGSRRLRLLTDPDRDDRGAGRRHARSEAGGRGWQTVATVTPSPTGAFSVAVTPTTTTLYRLATGGVRGALIRVDVSPA